VELDEDVAQRWGLANGVRHRECEAMRLTFPVIRVLSDDDGSDGGERGELKGPKHLRRRRVDGLPAAPLVCDEFGDRPEHVI
jgi:hypothetical protein